jgi:two-component system CheB/CheR fusion protein
MADQETEQPSDGHAAQTGELHDPDGEAVPGTLTAGSTLPPVVSEDKDDTQPATALPFSVVAIGASAGGVEAYIELFDHLPADTGMAYVVVPHLSAELKSHMREILARHSSMPVVQIETGTRPEPDRIYIIPPRTFLRLEGGLFHFDTPDERHAHRAIDYFFRSLADDQKNRAVGVILSGMDADGSQGMRAIKGEGGITMVQSPETAQFPDMPRSSIFADHVDIIGPPKTIAAQLGIVGRQFRQASLRMLQDGSAPLGEEHYFLRILSLMRSASGIDFRLYKPATIRRRIVRRMLLHGINTLAAYLSLLQSNPGETRELNEDALINVTKFFRDPEVFEAFQTSVLPRLLQNRDSGQQLRLWVAGCSTGEEVYSLAICLLEVLKGDGPEPPIQIFGTDASEQSIQKARAGLYSHAIANDVSPERLRRFFTKTEKGFQVSKRVRDLCIFARQNLCNDPPFSRIDVVSCRNVLIYFGAELQRQLIVTFHYALRQEGYLILGASETIREFTDLFVLLDRRHKIYSRNPGPSGRVVTDVMPRQALTDLPILAESVHAEAWGEIELQRAADRILLARYAPPGVVVNERMEIVQSRGHTAPFLGLRPGAASLHLGRLVRDSIAPQVTAAVRQAIEQDTPVQVDGLTIAEGEQLRQITLEVLPIHGVGNRSRCFLVLFPPSQTQDEKQPSAPETVPAMPAAEKDRVIAQVRQELASTKMYLHSLVTERDAKNQELISANEEIQSANEELQSTNEELETTKEELQSSNEELQTVNDELQNRNAILTRASNDLSNLLNSVNLPVLMLSSDLAIRQFTPPAQRIMNLRPADVGRPFRELRINLDIDDLAPLFTEVMETLTPREIEVQDREGHWYLLRVRPYRTADNKIEGLVVALLDIDQLRRSQQELRAARDFSRSVIESIPLPLAVVDLNFRIRATNDAFCAIAHSSAESLERRDLSELALTLWGLNEPLRSLLDQVRTASAAGSSFEFEHSTEGESSRVFSIRGCLLQPEKEQFLLITIQDLTTHREAERLLNRDKERLESEVEVAAKALVRTQDDLRALTGSLFTSQEEERRRIARELHDDVGQQLALLEIYSDQVEAQIPAGTAAAKEGIQQIRARIAALVDDVRLMSHRLHPSVIEDLGLTAALRTLVEEFAESEKMIATFSAQDTPDEISVPVATGLYRIAQEALRNVAKHAGKTHVRVTLRGNGGALQLQVADFGHGFDMDGTPAGLGLISMEERARMMGATLAVESSLGQGATVTVDVPAQPAG